MRGEVGKKTHKIEMDNTSFYDVTWLIFEKLCPVTKSGISINPKFTFSFIPGLGSRPSAANKPLIVTRLDNLKICLKRKTAIFG